MPIAEMPQSNKQHAVPQNIMDVEFKLIGDLTMRQFSYLLVCGVIAYISFTTVIGLFKWPLIIIFVLLGLALAFVPIQERGLDDWIAGFIKAVNSPTQRIWKKEPEIPTAFSYRSLDVVKQELITLAPTSSRRKLEEYLKYQVSSTHVDPLDIPEAKYAALVKESFAYSQTTTDYEPSGGAGVGISVIEEESLPEQVPQILPELKPEIKPEIVPESKPQIVPEKKVEKTPAGTGEDIKIFKPQTSQPTQLAQSAQSAVVQIPQQIPQQVQKPVTQPVQTQSRPVQTHPAPEQTAQQTQQKMHERNIEKAEAKLSEPLLKQGEIKERPDISFNPITPEMHSGRRFTNLLPAQGELILPIRGERVIKTSEQVDIEVDVKERSEKLQQLLAHIREKEMGESHNIQPAIPTGQGVIEAQVSKEAEDTVKKLKEQNEKLANDIARLKEDISNSKQIEGRAQEAAAKEQQLKGLVEQKEQINSTYSELGQKYVELQQKIEDKEKVSGPTPAPTPIPVQPQKQGPIISVNPISGVKTTVPGVPQTISSMRPMTTEPDVVSGIIKDNLGNVIPNALLLIKNAKGESVRAFKSNSLGQFLLLTPLDKGIYTIEVSPSNNLALTFDIISIDVKGEIVPPLEIKAK
jgi:hypothetical protein